VYPIGSKIATIDIAGTSWELFFGLNGSMRVFSFLPANGAWHTTFNADVKAFYDYLRSDQGFPASSQNLIGGQILRYYSLLPALILILVFQQGTEAFTGGPATYSVADYSASINF